MRSLLLLSLMALFFFAQANITLSNHSNQNISGHNNTLVPRRGGGGGHGGGGGGKGGGGKGGKGDEDDGDIDGPPKAALNDAVALNSEAAVLTALGIVAVGAFVAGF